jgi:hypothetical protein
MKLLAFVLMLAACAKDPHPDPSAGSATRPAVAPPMRPDAAVPVVDAAPPVDAYEDPDPGRRGKRTGLTATELPEVATEEFVRALAVGNLKVEAFIDPKRGVYQRIDLPGAGDTPGPMIAKRACGAQAAKVALAYLKRMVDAEARGHKATADESVHALECHNDFVTTADPHFGEVTERDPQRPARPMRYARCISPHIMEWDESFNLIFTPDPTRGLALVAVVSREGGALTERLWNGVATELGKPTGCP